MKSKMLKIFLLLLFLLSACKEALLHNLTEIEVNKLIGILNAEGIDGEKVLQTDLKWTLNVSKKDFVKSILILDSKRLLKDNTPVKNEKASLLGSNKEKDFYYERALSSELEKTLLTLNGVVDARVHLNVKKDGLLELRKDEKNENSAGVLMVVNEDEVFNEEQIKAIISGASGVKKEDVSIVISKIKILPDKKNNENIYFPAVSNDKNIESNFSFLSFLESIQQYIYIVVGIILCFFFVVFLRKKSIDKKLNLVKTVSMISK